MSNDRTTVEQSGSPDRRNTEHRSAKRSLELIEQIAIADGPLSLADLARQLELPKSSAHALIRTLTAEGYLQRGAADGRYALGPRLLRLVRALARQFALGEVARPVMRQLAEEFSETVLLGVRRDQSVYYIECIESPHPLRYVPDVGSPRPLHCTSIGKLYLADLPPDQLAPVVSELDLESLTDHTIVDPVALVAEIDSIRARGFSVNREESMVGAMAIAVPIRESFDPPRPMLAGVSIAGPADRVQPRSASVRERLFEAARTIGARAFPE